tara:strand:+ start:173 stop:292 length:120 start_codon:yes stop_codon:yes gene_type:complete
VDIAVVEADIAVVVARGAQDVEPFYPCQRESSVLPKLGP